MSVHVGAISGDVGGRPADLSVAVVHCERCEEVIVAPSALGEPDGVLALALAEGWWLDDSGGDLCPECRVGGAR